MAGLIYSIPAYADYLLVKILFKSSRVNGQIILTQSLQKIAISSVQMAENMYNLLPKYVFILAILFTFVIFCCKIWKENKRNLHIIKILYIVMGVTFAAIAPQIAQPTASIWFVPRSTYCFASLYGILTLYLSMNYELKNVSKIAIFIISLTLVIFQLQKFYKIEKDRYILNKKDEQITIQIIEQINTYEANTGNKISKIAIYQDSNPKYTYDGIFVVGDMNVKCYASDWSAVAILNYYLKRDLKFIDKDEATAQVFFSKNWDEFDEKQIVLSDDTLFLCKY